jgi:hypothetical protein
MGSGLLLRAVQEPTYYCNPPVETANNKVTALTHFSLVYTMGNVQFIWFDCIYSLYKKKYLIC